MERSISPDNSALTCVASPRNSTTSASTPFFLKKPFSIATYGVIESSDGGLREEANSAREQFPAACCDKLISSPKTVIPACFQRESRRNRNWTPDKDIRG